MSAQELVVVDLFPSLLQPEGDHGNAVMLADRARQYGAPARCQTVHPGQQIPTAEVYVLGGSEDQDMAECARALRRSEVMTRAVLAGAAVLGVGAGFTVLCREFTDSSGQRHAGLGLLDVEVVWDELADASVVTTADSPLGLPPLSGYEFHHGRARLGLPATPFARLEVGIGDGHPDSPSDGAVQGKVIGTWLHGPLLPRNPAVADLLLGWVRPDLVGPQPAVGVGPDDSLAAEVRAQRIRQARPTQ